MKKNEHSDIVLKPNNELLKKYFGDHQIFHDCYIKSINYDLFNCKLSIELIHYSFMDLLKKKRKLVYKIIFESIYDIRFCKKPIIAEEHYDEVTWDEYFPFKKKFYFLDCFFCNSKFSEFSEKYLNKQACKAIISFDNGLGIHVDCSNIKIVEPSLMKKYDPIVLMEELNKLYAIPVGK